MAPGINAARVVTLRASGADAYGNPRLECLVAGRWTRTSFEGVRWEDADAGTILQDTAEELIANMRRTELLPIDLSKEPRSRRSSPASTRLNCSANSDASRRELAEAARPYRRRARRAEDAAAPPSAYRRH